MLGVVSFEFYRRLFFNIPEDFMTFEQIKLNKQLQSTLASMGITVPTEIQQLAIPFALEGQDILASSETGSGKTYAYLLPLLQNLLEKPDQSAIVLSPTREIAVQIQAAAKPLLTKFNFGEAALLIGGQSMVPQLKALSRRPRIVIGTPGRVLDHLQRKTLNLNNCSFLVLDEFDRMLDIGFSKAIETIVGFLPRKRQTLMFSATISHEVEKLSSRYLYQPKRIVVNGEKITCDAVKQETIHTAGSDKFMCLINELENRDGAVIVFSKTKAGAEKLTERLKDRNYKALALHGNLRQNRRDQVVKAFREMRSRILVATDIAARGLDISHVKHVVNYDLPQCPEDYVHRIGRTGRAGNEGFAVSFITPEENFKWKRICRLVGMKNLPQPKKFTAPKTPFF